MEWLARGEVSRIEIKPEDIEHPWLKFAGTWADDPTFDEFQAEIECYRREIDAEYDADYQAQLVTMKGHILTHEKSNTVHNDNNHLP